MCTYVCRFKSRNFSWKPYSVPGFPRPLFLVKFLFEKESNLTFLIEFSIPGFLRPLFLVQFLFEKESNLTFLIEFFIPGFLRPLFLDQFLFETDSKLTIFDWILHSWFSTASFSRSISIRKVTQILHFLIEFSIPGFLRPLSLDQFLFEKDSNHTFFDWILHSWFSTASFLSSISIWKRLKSYNFWLNSPFLVFQGVFS